MTVELISQAEYAKRRGCSRTAVAKAVAAGRISLIEGKVDPAIADAQWHQNTRARVTLARPERAASASGADATAAGGDYWESRARREKAEADLAELKLAEAQGNLVRADVVRSELSRRVSGLREALLQIPARLAPVLAAESGAAAVHDQLQAELRQVMQQMAEAAPLSP